jgi:hypothetical protein
MSKSITVKIPTTKVIELLKAKQVQMELDKVRTCLALQPLVVAFLRYQMPFLFASFNLKK